MDSLELIKVKDDLRFERTMKVILEIKYRIFTKGKRRPLNGNGSVHINATVSPLVEVKLKGEGRLVRNVERIEHKEKSLYFEVSLKQFRTVDPFL